MLKESVIALLQAEKDKKVSEVTQTVSGEFDALMAAVQALVDDSSSPDVAALQAQVGELQKSLADAQAALADLQKKESDEAAKIVGDEAKIEKAKEDLGN